MAWKTRGGRRYYYRSVREGGRVRSEYIGPEPQARLFALLDELDRQDRREQRDADRQYRAECREEDRALDELVAAARAEANRLIEAAGYHRHKGQWRRHRRRGHPS